MYRRLLVASLTVMTFTMDIRADVYRNEEHQLEAHFPAKVVRINKSLETGGKVMMAYSRVGDQSYLLGASIEKEYIDNEQNETYAQAFIQGVMESRKNARITLESELKISEYAPMGKCFIVKHDAGWLFAWTTIENGKGYFIMIEAKSEDAFQSQAVKAFQKSVKITGMK